MSSDTRKRVERKRKIKTENEARSRHRLHLVCSICITADVPRKSGKVSGVAGPLAARGGGQICRPFVLGFV